MVVCFSLYSWMSVVFQECAFLTYNVGFLSFDHSTECCISNILNVPIATISKTHMPMSVDIKRLYNQFVPGLYLPPLVHLCLFKYLLPLYIYNVKHLFIASIIIKSKDPQTFPLTHAKVVKSIKSNKLCKMEL